MQSDLPTDAVILCGGAGSRLQAVVPDRQKALAPVKGEPLLGILARDLAAHGFRRLILAAGAYADQVRSYAEEIRRRHPKLTVIVSEERVPLGTGGAVKNAERHLAGGPFFVMNGDSLYTGMDYAALARFHAERRSAVSLALAKPRAEADYGAVTLDAAGRVVSFAEKRGGGGFMNMGVYCMSPAALTKMPASAFSLENDFFPALSPHELHGFPSGASVTDIGTPERYAAAQRPKISVISPSFNTGRFFRATADSILSQSYKDFEYIIVDGGSTDGTVDIIREYAAKDSRVRFISEKDCGYLDALNKGFAMARGDYVMQCAISDGYVDPDWFAKCAAALDRDPEVSLVWGLIEYRDEQGARGDTAFPQFHHYDPPQKERFFYYWLTTLILLPEHTFCMRRKMLADCFPAYEAGKLQPEWHMFNYRFNARGYVPQFIRSVAAFARIHEGQAGGYETVSFKRAIVDCYAMAAAYRNRIVACGVRHTYRDADGNRLLYRFSRLRAMLAYSAYVPVKTAYGLFKPLFKPLIPLFSATTQVRLKKFRRLWY